MQESSFEKPESSLTSKLNFISRISIIVIVFMLITFFLKQTSSISVTVFVGLLLGVVFFPLDKFFRNKWHFPSALSLLCTVIVFLGISVLLITLLYASLSSVNDYFDFYRNRVTTIIDTVFSNIALDKVNLDIINQLQSGAFSFLRDTALSFSAGAINIGKNYLLVTITLMFTIIELSWIKEKSKRILSDEKKEKSFDSFLERISGGVSKFILLKALISFCTGVIIYFAFEMIGVNFPLLWGFLTFLFNFIPSVGSLIISIVSILFSILQFYPSWSEVIIITIVILLTQVIIGNVIDPKITGDNLNLSALIIFVGLVYWGYVWGIMGMLLSVPLLVLMRTVCDYIPYLNKISVILGNGSTVSKMNKKDKKNKLE